MEKPLLSQGIWLEEFCPRCWFISFLRKTPRTLMVVLFLLQQKLWPPELLNHPRDVVTQVAKDFDGIYFPTEFRFSSEIPMNILPLGPAESRTERIDFRICNSCLSSKPTAAAATDAVRAAVPFSGSSGELQYKDLYLCSTSLRRRFLWQLSRHFERPLKSKAFPLPPLLRSRHASREVDRPRVRLLKLTSQQSPWRHLQQPVKLARNQEAY